MLISQWTRLLDVGNITNICVSRYHAFCVDTNNNLYVIKFNLSTTENAPQIIASTDKWTKFTTLPKQVVQMSSNGTSLWLLYNDGSINYILLTMTSTELQARAIALQEAQAIALAEAEAEEKAKIQLKLLQTRAEAEAEEKAKIQLKLLQTRAEAEAEEEKLKKAAELE